MAYKVVVLPSADESLDLIMDYLSRFYSGKGAARSYAQFQKKTAALMDNPYMAPQDEDDPRYRRLVVDQYLVYYLVDDELERVSIYRVLRASWNIPEHL